jgi:YHS domain-containing protein
MNQRFFRVTGLFLALSLFSMTIYAQDATAQRKQQYNLEKGVAISGYDPVAYFTAGKAVKGKADEAVFFQGVTYYFSSAANKEAFKKNPSAYEPAYGGWCAYAMGAKGEKVEVDPKTFKITGGRLFLFYNKYFNNTLTDWNKDEQSLKQKADVNWTKIYH